MQSDETHDSIRRAALVVASLPEREAADLLARMPEDVVEQIARFLPTVEHLERLDRDSVALEFASAVSGLVESVRPRIDLVKREARRLALGRADLDRLALRMSNELPQTAALLMRALDVDRAADLLSRLPTHQQLGVVLRLQTAANTDDAVLADLIQVVVSDDPADVIGEACGVDLLVRLLLRLDHATEKALLENLSQEAPDLVDRLLQAKLVLGDLQRLDQTANINRDELVDAVLRLRAVDEGSSTSVQGVPKAA